MAQEMEGFFAWEGCMDTVDRRGPGTVTENCDQPLFVKCSRERGPGAGPIGPSIVQVLRTEGKKEECCAS